MTNQEIHDICKRYAIKNYTINSDGSIDVNGDVDLSYKNLDRIPIKFNKVSGSFSCYSNQLTSLEGCPNNVTSWFNCSFNKLTSLKGCPNYIGGTFYCGGNPLESLEGYNDDYDRLVCYNKEILVNKHKRSKKLKEIQNI